MALKVRTALLALIAFMPTKPNGALGSLEYTKEERRALAIKSRDAAPRFGTPERQKLIDEIHEYMLSKASTVLQIGSSQASDGQNATETQDEVEGSPGHATPVATQEEPHDPTATERIIEEQPHEVPIQNPQPLPATHSNDQLLLPRPEHRIPRQADDRLFTWAAIGLTIAIVVLLLKKFIKAGGHGAYFRDES